MRNLKQNRLSHRSFGLIGYRHKIPGLGSLLKGIYLPLGCAVCLAATNPMTAHAASPEFARSTEEWQKLQDDILEYEEIDDLIHEYNATVQNNQYEYNKFIQDYGITKDDIRDEYLQLADDLEASKSGDDSGSAMVSDMQLQLQADQLREQADDNLEDSHIYYLNYAQAEASLALSAKSKYISYYKSLLELDSAREQGKTLQSSYNLTAAKRQAGMATEAEVLDAQEALLTQENTISSLEQQIESSRQALIVMLGWSSGAQPELTGVPEMDLDEIAAIDLEADKEAAVENNYTLQVNQRKYENALDTTNKSNLQRTITDNKRQIGLSVASAYQSLQTAKLSYEQAVSDAETAARNMELTQQKWNAGMITSYDYEQQQAALAQKQLAVEEAKLELLDALETYRSNVNGLASAE